MCLTHVKLRGWKKYIVENTRVIEVTPQNARSWNEKCLGQVEAQAQVCL